MSDTRNALAHHLGSTVKEIRHSLGLTIADVAASSGISRGMLSRIENAQTATSLETLAHLAKALGVSLATLFRGYDTKESSAQLVRQGEGLEVVRRGTKRGHTYHLLAHEQGPQKFFEPFLISIDNDSETFPIFEHPGTEFIYMLEGQIEYRHGDNTYALAPGDALTFPGDIPHGPEKLIECPIQFLSVLMYPEVEKI
ncbi:MAG: XRE family transcriptional regulator [Zoogloeaceae bacterium]|jgi:transcriptional regulator with XRE-family HTH domain|nr:XRE family transcriptional regulator [Zoogloeaceae bacterium]